MSNILKQLTINQDLVLDFFATFSRFEFALKTAGYVTGSEKSASADWGAFARRHHRSFHEFYDVNNLAEIDYLLSHPPKKQVLQNGKLVWRDSPPDKHLSYLENCLLMVRRVRNNLFHGGKYPGGYVKDSSRDSDLLHVSIHVLKMCIPLSKRVEEHFNRTDWTYA